jgi:hypothetical protein
MTAGELDKAILAHFAAHPRAVLSVPQLTRGLGFSPGMVSSVRTAVRRMQAAGELTAVEGARDEADTRPCTRWGLAGGITSAQADGN